MLILKACLDATMLCLNCDAVKKTSYREIIKSHCLILDAAGSINISNILTGKCLAKINATNGSPKDEECSSSTGSSKQSRLMMRSTVAAALEDITALFYDEERNEIYTGNRHGLVHVWSN
ncbi:hypothetical protein POTOM_052129 [Populus tomentosa]|uniref:Uncharacterized protein n=1 Tax=Populus tomentosa TaxID=118781 RepID=A0A8X7YAW6_POPTO|nr:hypothetical protein POTOM_052129 [Populus tomentosa]